MSDLDEAVEAAAATSRRKHLRDEAETLAYKARIREVLEAAAPLIVKAERDRLREAIEGLRVDASTGPLEDRDGLRCHNAAIRAALAVIDEKGDTDG